MNFKHIIKDSFAATVLYMLVAFFFLLAPWKRSFNKAIPGGGDFELYDLKFTGSANEQVITDTNIVLIEIGNSRSEIADQLILLSKYSPRIIGIDALFSSAGDTLEDIKMSFALSRFPAIVTGGNYADTPVARLDSGFFADIPNTQTSYLNLNAPSDYSVIRTYYPGIKNGDGNYESFSTCILKNYDSARYKKLQKRNFKKEVINYSGTLNNYLNLSKAELVEYDETGQLELLNGKIVLLGFFKNSLPDVLDDLRFTPMNKRLFGKSFPDMYGLVIHANILTMALNDNYITETTSFQTWTIAFVLAFLYNVFLFYFNNRKTLPHKRFFPISQYLIIILLGYFFLKLFDAGNIKVALEPIISLLVISVAMAGLYKKLALFLHKKFNFKTTFKPDIKA